MRNCNHAFSLAFLFVFIEICLGVDVLQDPAVMIQSMADPKFGTEIICFVERESDTKKVGETASASQEQEFFGNRFEAEEEWNGAGFVVVVGMSHGINIQKKMQKGKGADGVHPQVMIMLIGKERE